jgi:glycosyltransferase involved in cell wall biosynthesis
MSDALVIVPTFNERESLVSVLTAIRVASPAIHVLVVDDNSPDGTGQLADEFARTNPTVHVIHRPAKQGLGPAYIAGFRWAFDRGYDWVVEIDADHWKTWLHDRLAVKLLDEKGDRTPGSLSLYHTATPKEHQALVKHLTAERKMREFIAGKGEVIFWDQIRKQNHWLDTGYTACAAAWMCGVRLIPDFEQPRVHYEENPPITTPDGRAFLITERD